MPHNGFYRTKAQKNNGKTMKDTNKIESKKKISKKISKIMHEGVRGKKVKQNQAVAIALSMARKKKI